MATKKTRKLVFGDSHKPLVWKAEISLEQNTKVELRDETDFHEVLLLFYDIRMQNERTCYFEFTIFRSMKNANIRIGPLSNQRFIEKIKRQPAVILRSGGNDYIFLIEKIQELGLEKLSQLTEKELKAQSVAHYQTMNTCWVFND